MKKNDVTLGICFIILSGIGFSFMSLFVKLSGDLPTLQKSFFRNFITLLVVSVLLLKHKEQLQIPKNNTTWIILVARALFGTLGLVFQFYAISNINLADASIIQKVSPFIILIFSFLFFKEKISKIQIISIFIAFFGIVLVVKPTSGVLISQGSLAALSAAVFSGIAYTCVRYLGINKISGDFIIFFFSLFSSLSLVPSLFLSYHPMTLHQVLLLIGAGLSATLGQYGITYAYYYTAARSIVVFDYIQVVFTGILGYIFFLELPDFISLCGYVIIIGVGIFSTMYSNKPN